MNKNIVLNFIEAASPENLERVVVALYKRGMTLPSDQATAIGNIIPMDTVNLTAARLSDSTPPELWGEVTSSIDGYDFASINEAFTAVVARGALLGGNFKLTLTLNPEPVPAAVEPTEETTNDESTTSV